jgi:hypothetical protein
MLPLDPSKPATGLAALRDPPASEDAAGAVPCPRAERPVAQAGGRLATARRDRLRLSDGTARYGDAVALQIEIEIGDPDDGFVAADESPRDPLLEAAEARTEEAQLEIDHPSARTDDPTVVDREHLLVGAVKSNPATRHVILQGHRDPRSRGGSMPVVTYLPSRRTRSHSRPDLAGRGHPAGSSRARFPPKRLTGFPPEREVRPEAARLRVEQCPQVRPIGP